MTTTRRRHTFKGRDLAEISLLRVLLIVASSLVFISFFVRTTYYTETTFTSSRQIVGRALAVYSITLVAVAAMLLAVDKLPLAGDTLVAIKRAIIVAFPASFAATAVDSLGD